jgi:predicted flap endonuclease-1-like 5' DNA nuclease
MSKEPNHEVQSDDEPVVDLVRAPRRPSQTPPPPPVGRAARASAPDEAEITVAIDVDLGSGDDLVGQMLPPSSASSPPPPPTRFNTAAPLAPPRPSSTATPVRPSNVPPAPRMPAAQAMEKVAELQEQLELAKRTLVTRDTEIRTLLTQRDARIAELETVKSQLAAREFTIKELEFAVLAKETKIRDLENEMESLRRPGEGPGDDLQQIRGIGRAFERELKRIGVRTFAQIAAWTQADIDAIAPQIKAQPERIRRDGWVQHASELILQRNARG